MDVKEKMLWVGRRLQELEGDVKREKGSMEEGWGNDAGITEGRSRDFDACSKFTTPSCLLIDAYSSGM